MGSVTERTAAMVRSACSDDPRAARTLLAAEPALASYDLVTACATGDVAAAAALIDPGRLEERVAPLGWTPLLYACFSRLLRDSAHADGIVAVARLLLEAGADPNASFLDHEWVQVPVYGAAGIANSAELTRLLLSYGADPHETLTGPDDIGEALYHAVEFADTTCAELLLEAGTAPHRISYCLGRALDFPRAPMVLLLLSYGAKPTSGHLQRAITAGHSADVVRALLDAGAPASPAALGLAMRWERDDVVALLVDKGADLSAMSVEDTTPDAEMLHEAVRLGDVARVQRVLDAGVPVDASPPGDDGTALASACWRGNLDLVRLLVARGASLVWPEGSPIGATLHGSQHCHDPHGGPMSLPVDEVRHGDYAGVLRYLLAAGATIPLDYGDGTASAASILTDLGVTPKPES
jgi:ankyrin repeat protein